MKQRHRKRRSPVRDDIPRGWTLIGVDYGTEWVAALKGDPGNKGAHAAYNDMKRLIQGEVGEVFRTKIVPAPRLSAESEAALVAGLPIGRDGRPADPEKFGVIAIDSAMDAGAAAGVAGAAPKKAL